MLKYSIDGGDNWNTYVDSVILSAEGVYAVVATQSVNGVKSAYSPAIALRIDKTLPNPPVISGIIAGAYKINQNFNLSGEPGAALEYSINGGNFWQIYTGDVVISAEGTYTVTARQTDIAANVSANAAPVNIVIDKSAQPPVMSGIAAGYYNSTQTFSLAGEVGASIEYSLDAGDNWDFYSDPVSIDDEGTYNIVARQTDALGNNSDNSDIIELIIDLTQPDPPVVSGITAGQFNAFQAFTVSGDTGSTFECSIDGGLIFNVCVGEQTLSIDGVYNVTARQIDRAGNVSAQSNPIQVKIDTTSPDEVTSLTATPAIGQVVLTWADPSNIDFAKVQITFSPAASGVPQPIEIAKGVQSVAINPLIDGTEYTFTLKTVDTLGNISAGKTISRIPNDNILPVAGNGGALTVSDVRPRSFWISWTGGSDNITPQGELQYKIVRSLSSNISTVEAAETNGYVVKNWTDILYWTTGQTSWQITGLSFDATYFYNVLVRDKAGNKAIYAMGSRATLTVPELTDVNGAVSALALNGDTLYIGGAFTEVNGPGYGTLLDTVTGTFKEGTNSPIINGDVSVVISDGMGGWYIGGSFTSVNNITRNRIARINSDGSLHAWNPNSNNTVLALARKGNLLYAGGSFTSIGGQTRNRIAAIDIRTGLASSWNPDANANVNAIATGDGVIYAGGAFTVIQTKARTYIAAIDETAGTATAWSPNANAAVNTIVVNGGIVYAGGAFTNIGAAAKNYIAAIDSSGGATIWNPAAQAEVNSLVLDGGILYVAGNFTTIGGQTRNRIAAYNISTGVITSWYPTGGADVRVRSLAVTSDTVYAAGEFITFAGQSRSRVAAADKGTGAIKTWNPNASGTAISIAADAGTGTIFAGGSFAAICSYPRNRLAAIDVKTGKVKSWNPNANNTVSTITVSGTTVYFGGLFTTIGGQTRNYIASVDAETGSLTTWNPSANAVVSTITINGDIVYAGGNFTNIGGYARNYIAAVDKNTGVSNAWNPNANFIYEFLIPVFVNVFNNNILYTGGTFTTLRGVTRNRMGAIDLAGDPTSFNPNFTHNGLIGDLLVGIRSILISGDLIYIGGNYTNIGATVRSRIAAFNKNTGALTSWNPEVQADEYTYVSSIAVSNDIVYFGGYFATVGATARSNIAAVSVATGSVITAWNPGIDGGVTSILINGDTVYVGGSFDTAAGKSKKNLAAIDKNTGVVW